MAVFRHPTWKRFKAEHPPGSKIIGQAGAVLPYGVFVDLGRGMLWRAFLPVELMAPVGQAKNFPVQGDTIAAYVLSYKDESRRILLTQIPDQHVAATA
jgi:ribosomal protein S1